MRYFETLNLADEVCLIRADKVLKWIGVDSFERENTFMQVGDDCAWWLMHYAEVEARMEHGEGLGLA